MDKWRLELAQIKKEFERGSFKERVGGNVEVKRKDCDFCNPPDLENTDGVLTMAFVNMQPLSSVYSVAEAMENGTLFPNIDKPLLRGKRQ